MILSPFGLYRHLLYENNCTTSLYVQMLHTKLGWNWVRTYQVTLRSDWNTIFLQKHVWTQVKSTRNPFEYSNLVEHYLILLVCKTLFTNLQNFFFTKTLPGELLRFHSKRRSRWMKLLSFLEKNQTKTFTKDTSQLCKLGLKHEMACKTRRAKKTQYRWRNTT